MSTEKPVNDCGFIKSHSDSCGTISYLPGPSCRAVCDDFIQAFFMANQFTS